MQLMTFNDFRAVISIVEIALANGYYQDKKKGSKWPVLKNDTTGDKIIIVNPQSFSNQGYFNPELPEDKGTLVHFIKNRLGPLFPKDTMKTDLENVNTVLYSWLKMDPVIKVAVREKIFIPKESKPFILPELKEFANRSYLKGRYINDEVLSSPLFANRIFNTVYSGFYINTCFPYYSSSGSIIGLEIRNQSVKMHQPGSNRSAGVWHSNVPPQIDRIIIAESPIDALSYHQLKKPVNAMYIGVGGRLAKGQVETVKQIKNAANCGADFKYVGAVDNDKDGKMYNAILNEILGDRFEADYPAAGYKDYNNQLEETVKSNLVKANKIGRR